MTSSSSRMTLAVACATALLAASSASAATLSGTVVGQPKSASGGRVVVPVLLSAAGAKVAGDAVAKVSVPVKRGLRTKSKSIKSSDLRIGDRVKTTVARISGHARVAVLRITSRGAAPTFAKLSAGRTTAIKTTQQAVTAVDQIKANPMTLLNPATPATSNAALRAQLLAVRDGLNTLIATMRSNADGIDKAVATIQRARPVNPTRHAAVVAQQQTLLAGLMQSSTASRAAADQLDSAVTYLDQAIDDIGGASSPSIGVNEVGTVSDVLHAVLQLLRDPVPA